MQGKKQIYTSHSLDPFQPASAPPRWGRRRERRSPPAPRTRRSLRRRPLENEKRIIFFIYYRLFLTSARGLRRPEVVGGREDVGGVLGGEPEFVFQLRVEPVRRGEDDPAVDVARVRVEERLERGLVLQHHEFKSARKLSGNGIRQNVNRALVGEFRDHLLS